VLAPGRLGPGDTALNTTLRERIDQVLWETALEHTEGHRRQAGEKPGLGRNAVTRKLGVVRGEKITY
jgi:two-component system nitrogen regulation response regulator GlnG